MQNVPQPTLLIYSPVWYSRLPLAEKYASLLQNLAICPPMARDFVMVTHQAKEAKCTIMKELMRFADLSEH